MRFLLDHDVPQDLSYLLDQLGHDVVLLRNALPAETVDEKVFEYAQDNNYILLTFNRDDFLELAKQQSHHGIVVVIRRRTRAAERAALFRLLERAGEVGLRNNVNFA